MRPDWPAVPGLNRNETTGRPLSRLLEIEVLNAGITTKESLWRTLAIIQKHRPELVGLDVDELRQRARRQRKLLESYRGATAEEAFAAGS